MNRSLKLAFVCASALACVPVFAADAAPPIPTHVGYSVFVADQNGDGCGDYLVKAADAAGSAADAPFALMSGAGCSYSLAQGASLAALANGQWKDANYQVKFGDVRGDGGSWLLAPVASDALPTFNVARDPATGALSLLQVLKSSDFRIGAPGVTVSVEVTHGDRRTDLVLRRGEDIVGAYAAGPDGTFAATGDANFIALSHAVWNSFLTCARRDDVACALATMSRNFRPEARTSFEEHGANLSGFARMVTKFDVNGIYRGFTTAVVILAVDGQQRTVVVHLTEDFDGSWKIAQM